MSGVLLILLGLWGGLIPLIGPYIHFAYTPNRAWAWSSGRFWLEVLPGITTLAGGVIVLITRLRPVALLGASLSLLSGAWFAFGTAFAPLWTGTLPAQGYPVGGPVARAVEQIGYFGGLGVLIACIASIALGRLAVISAKDMRTAARRVSRAADQTAAIGQATAVGAKTDGDTAPASPSTWARTIAAHGPGRRRDSGRTGASGGTGISGGGEPDATDRRGWRLAGRIGGRSGGRHSDDSSSDSTDSGRHQSERKPSGRSWAGLARQALRR